MPTKEIEKKYPVSYKEMLDIAGGKIGEEKYIQCAVWHGDRETIGFVYQTFVLGIEVLNICYQQLAFHPSKPSIYGLSKECRFNPLTQ